MQERRLSLAIGGEDGHQHREGERGLQRVLRRDSGGRRGPLLLDCHFRPLI
jgi:hypothetical protein